MRGLFLRALLSPRTIMNGGFLSPLAWHAHCKRCCTTANSVASRTDKLCVSRFCRIVMKINSQAAACESSFSCKFANTVHVLDVLRLNKVCYSVPSDESWDCHHLAITDGEGNLTPCCIYMWMKGKQYLWLMLADQMLYGISPSRAFRKTKTTKHSDALFWGDPGRGI